MAASLAKVSPPESTRVYPREHLFERLDWARSFPILWVTGPAGSGKTTLIRSYLACRDLSVVWYTLDRRDDDPAAFFYFFPLAVERAFPDLDAELSLLTPEYRSDLDLFVRRYFEQLYAALPKPVWVVLDDAQALAEGSSFQTVLRDGLAHPPRGVRLAGVSRRGLPSSLARQRANGRVATIGARELKLSEEELAGLVHFWGLAEQPSQAADLARSLHRLTDGWAAGTVLIREWMQLTGGRPEKLQAGPPSSVFDYFAAEVFERTDPLMRRFLLETAVPPVVTPALAHSLTGFWAADARERLDRQEFVERHEAGAATYRYHPLFRAFLLDRLRADLDSRERRALYRRAARALLEHDRVEEAVEVLAAIEDADELSALIRRHAPLLLRQGRVETLASWLALLPEKVVEEQGWLRYWRAIATLNLRPEDAPPLLEAALAQFRREGDVRGAYLAWADWVDAAHMVGVDLRPLDDALDVLEALGAEQPEFPSSEVELRVAGAAFNALLWRQRDEAALARWAERVTRLARDWPDPERRVGAALWVVVYHLEQGDLVAAEEVFHRIVGDVTGATPWLRGCAAHVGSVFWYWRGAPERALQVAREGLDAAREAGLGSFETWLVGNCVMVYLGRGQLEASQESLERIADGIERRPPHEATFYHYLACWAAVLSGRLAEAQTQHALWVSKHERAGYRLHLPLEAVADAQIQFELGQHQAAEEQLSYCLALSRRRSSKTWEYLALCMRAYFRLVQGHREQAHDALREAFALGREAGLVITPFWRRRVMSRLCVEALESGIEVDYAAHLARHHEFAPVPAPLHLEAWPFPIRVRTLGRVEIERDGRPIRFGHKLPRRPLELLGALVAFGGQGVPSRRLSDALWPDADGDLAYRSFASTVHRLRQLLGTPDVLIVESGTVTLDPRRCWVDLWALEDQVERFRSADHTEDASVDLDTDEATSRLLDLYRGPFLPGDAPKPWVLAARRSALSCFRAGVESIGRRFQEAGDWEAARRLYRGAMEAARTCEPFYRGLMRSLLALGRPEDAAEVFERCRDALREKGAEPSAVTAALVEAGSRPRP